MVDSHTEFTLNRMHPAEIAAPHTPVELAQFLAKCNAQKCAVVPWGGGTLQHLGNAPVRYDAVLQTTNLNQIVEYAPEDLTGTFGAGMTIAEIDRALGENGQFLPLDVPHPERATLGGVLATGMNGTLRLRYGPARDYMLGNRFATVDGQIIKAGSKVVKNVAGYELHKVQVGAFGTLGILTEATFKLFPKPPAETTVLASFEKVSDACAAVPQFWNLRVPPIAIELLGAEAMHLVEPGASGGYHVAVRFGGSKATMAAALDLASSTANEHHARTVTKVSEEKAFWRAVADLPSTLREMNPDTVMVRVSVPPKELDAALQLLLAFKPAPRIFAHAAVASMYASFESDMASSAADIASLRAQLHEIHGHLVVEHAPPALKASLDVWDDVGASLKLMQSLKRKFDPNNILNPGRFVAGI